MASLRRLTRPLTTHRTFSTHPPRLINLQWEKNHPESLAEALPPYPHGPTRLYKQSAKGLYGGQRLQFGNNVSDRHAVKSRRQWHPNIKTKRLFSKALNRYVQVRVSTRVLRTIDKLGGVDEYLLGEKAARVRELGESGWWLRWAVMQTQGVRKRFAGEREALGIPGSEEEVQVVEQDAEATLAASVPDEEVAEVASAEGADLEADPEEHGVEGVSGLLAEDDAFQVEEDKSLPPLKFRVGPGQHVVLTERGWRRTRPYDTRVQDRKDRIWKDEERFFMKVRMAELEAQMEELTVSVPVPRAAEPVVGVEGGETAEVREGGEGAAINAEPAPVQEVQTETVRPLTEAERTEIVKAAQKQWKAELSLRVDDIYAKKMATRDERREQLKAQKREKKARQSTELAANVA